MKTSNIFWGILFIVLGVLYLVVNVFSLPIYLSSLYEYWPIILILFGLSFMSGSKPVKAFTVGASALFLALVMFSFFKSGCNDCKSDEDYTESYSKPTETYSRIYEPSIKNVDLEIVGAAGTFSVSSDSLYLFNISGKALSRVFEIDTMASSNYYSLSLGMKENVINLEDGKLTDRKFKMGFHPNPVYKVKCDLGAASADLDFRKLKIEKLDLQMGAATLNLELNEPPGEITYVDIEAGASSIEISIPKFVGSELTNNMAISDKKFNGFKRIRDNLHQTENFSSSKKKIIFKLDGGVSKITIRQY